MSERIKTIKVRSDIESTEKSETLKAKGIMSSSEFADLLNQGYTIINVVEDNSQDIGYFKVTLELSHQNT